MRGTNSRDLILKDIFVTQDDLLMPRGGLGKTPPNWPHMMATPSPTYMGRRRRLHPTLAYLQGARCPANRRLTGACMPPSASLSARCMPVWPICAPRQAFMECKGFPSKAERCGCMPRNTPSEGVQEIAAMHPHLWWPVDAEVAALGTHVPRQPLRRVDAALYFLKSAEDYIGALALIRDE